MAGLLRLHLCLGHRDFRELAHQFGLTLPDPKPLCWACLMSKPKSITPDTHSTRVATRPYEFMSADAKGPTNFANERLQNFFNAYILQSEQEDYMMEAIAWTPLKVPDNQDYIDLVDKKPNGILAVLDSACQMPKGNPEAFIQNLFQIHKHHPRMAQVRRVRKKSVTGVVPINGFSIVHYAGKVIYNVDDFLVKNNDAPSADNVSLFAASSSSVIQVLLSTELETQVEKPGGAAPRRRGGTFKYTGGFFTKQLTYLMNTLYAATPYFVRCIKPNAEKKAGKFDWGYVRPQLECGGISEALRILKCGYPTRCSYDDIFDRYGHIMNPTPPDLNKRDLCEAVLRMCGEGLDREECFFRPGKQEFLEELLTGPEMDQVTILKIERFLLNKRFQRARGAITAHISFNFIMRKMRAETKAKKLFAMTKVLSGTFINCLADQRKAIAASRMQAAARAIVAAKEIRVRKQATMQIAAFYQHNMLRKIVKAKVDKRVKVKIANQSKAEALAREKREEEKQLASKAEAKAKEEARLAAIRKKKEEEEANIKVLEDKAKAEKEKRGQRTYQAGTWPARQCSAAPPHRGAPVYSSRGIVSMISTIMKSGGRIRACT